MASAPVAPTIDEVARLCGVSKGTVSKALNDRSRLVSPSTRAQILKVAESIGFKASWRARALATQRSQMIAVLHSSENNAVLRTVYWDLADRLDELFRAQGYSMVFIHARETYPDLEQKLSDGRFDGVLGVGLIDPGVLDLIRRRGLPAVLINVGGDKSWTRVVPDDVDGTRKGMAHLQSLGHERIVFYSSVQLGHAAWVDRTSTYRQVMVDAGLEPLEPFVGPPATFADWWRSQSSATRPTAVLDFSHWSAIGLLQALWRAKIGVPEDVSIVTFNDAYPAAEMIPPLTTIGLPSHDMANAAARLILELIDEPGTSPQSIVLPERLVVRESTAKPRQ